MDYRYVLHHRLSGLLILSFLFLVPTSAWLSSVFVRDAAFVDFAESANRGHWLVYLPRPLTATVFGAFAVAVAVAFAAMIRAAAKGQVLAILDTEGVTFHPVLGSPRQLPWSDIDKVTWSKRFVAFHPRPGLRRKVVSIPLYGQDLRPLKHAISRFHSITARATWSPVRHS